MNYVQEVNGVPVTSSKDVAALFGKSHKHVLDSARRLMIDLKSHGRESGRQMFFESEYTTDRGKVYKNVLMTRDGFSLLAMGFTGASALEWKIKLLDAFNQMEAYINKDAGGMLGKINSVSQEIDALADAGSAWGKTGSEIRKKKREAIEHLEILIDNAQMSLGFVK